ncbi:MAG: cupin domain-containing protein [Arenicella sp.]|nr:cupin domain-containing protein [Arenicella sp.]
MSKQNPPFVVADPDLIEPVADGIKRRLLAYGPDLMAVKVWFEEGAIGYQHQHIHTQVAYVESGEFEAMIDGETQILRAGDSFYVAPNKLHGAVCKKAGVLIDIFNPQREDFLKGE